MASFKSKQSVRAYHVQNQHCIQTSTPPTSCRDAMGPLHSAYHEIATTPVSNRPVTCILKAVHDLTPTSTLQENSHHFSTKYKAGNTSHFTKRVGQLHCYELRSSSSSPMIPTKTYTLAGASSHIMKSNSSSKLHAVNGWLEAMRETSPARTTNPPANACSSSLASHDDLNCMVSHHFNNDNLLQRAWFANHPSALDKFKEIVEAANGKRVAVFLDYDGTLSPIVQDPDKAFMSHEMREILKEVANVFPTAIISGRCKEKLHDLVQLPELYYAGSHGLDITGPPKHNVDATKATQEKEKVLFQPARDFTNIINEVFQVLKVKTKDVPGAKVEHNKFCVTVHFRCVNERHWVALAEQVHQVLQSYPNLQLTQGRKILEIRPLIAWNKGKALDYLLKALGLGDQNSVFPIYIGDDRSDEDAFKVINGKKFGLGILVTNVARETHAVCSLQDPAEVGELLKRLVKWKRRRLSKFP